MKYLVFSLLFFVSLTTNAQTDTVEILQENEANKKSAQKPMRDTIYIGYPSVAATPEKTKKKVSFYGGFQIFGATNSNLENLGGIGAGITPALGVRIKRQFTVGIGAGIFATIEDTEDVGEFVTHYPLYVELQYIGKWKFNPYLNIQGGIVMSEIDEVPFAKRNEKSIYASVKGGFALGKNGKFAMFVGYSIINVANTSLGDTFLTGGIGFAF